MKTFNPSAVGKTIGAILVILPSGYLAYGITGFCMGSILIGVLIFVSNLQE